MVCPSAERVRVVHILHFASRIRFAFAGSEGGHKRGTVLCLLGLPEIEFAHLPEADNRRGLGVLAADRSADDLL